jgi:hypothetical protein
MDILLVRVEDMAPGPLADAGRMQDMLARSVALRIPAAGARRDGLRAGRRMAASFGPSAGYASAAIPV